MNHSVNYVTPMFQAASKTPKIQTHVSHPRKTNPKVLEKMRSQKVPINSSHKTLEENAFSTRLNQFQYRAL